MEERSTNFKKWELFHRQVPLAVPCYDFAPIIGLTFTPLKSGASGPPDSLDVTGGEYTARERIHRGIPDPRLLAIPASRGRVADPDPNWDRLLGIGSPLRVRNPLYRPLYHECSPGHKGHADLTSSPPSSRKIRAVPHDTCNMGQGLRSLPHLREHLRARADDSRAAPVLEVLAEGLPFGRLSSSMSSPGKVFRLLSN